MKDKSISLRCTWCDTRSLMVKVTAADLKRYLMGDLVQDVWPDFTDEQREVLCGMRTGVYTCPKCWDEMDAE